MEYCNDVSGLSLWWTITSHKFASNVALIDGVKSCPLLRNSELDDYKDVEKKAKRTNLVHKFNVSAVMQVSRG